MPKIHIFYMFPNTCCRTTRYTGWLCRSMVSATTFTLVGVVNKFLTVLLNVVVWDKHSSPVGVVAVCACLLAGAFYQQAPRRDEAHHSSTPLQNSASSNSACNTGTHGKRDCDTPVRVPDVTPLRWSSSKDVELTERAAASSRDSDPLLSEES